MLTLKSRTSYRWLIIGITFVLTIAVMAFWNIDSTEAPSGVRTRNREQHWMQNALDRHILLLQKSGDKVRIVSDGFLVRTLDSKPASNIDFLLPLKGEFYNQPDDHSSMIFRLDEISADGVVIHYESQFSQLPFGKNTVTIDTGEVVLKWKK